MARWSENSDLYIRGGQDKTLYGREFIVPSERMQMVERSLVTQNFTLGFQTGMLLHARLSNALFIAAGVYNGNGINQEENDSNEHLFVGRASITILGRGAPMVQSDTMRSSRPYLNIGVGGYVQRGAREFDANGAVVAEYKEISGASVDATFRYGGLSLMHETHIRSNDTTGIDESGWLVQGGVLIGRRLEFAARYGWHDDNDDDNGTEEIRAGLNFFFLEDPILAHRFKLQVDVGQISDELLDQSDTEVRAQISLHF